MLSVKKGNGEVSGEYHNGLYVWRIKIFCQVIVMVPRKFSM